MSLVFNKRGWCFIAPTLVTIVTMNLNGVRECWECIHAEYMPNRDCLYPMNTTTAQLRKLCDASKGYTACAKGIGNFRLKLNYAPVINGTSPENITIQIANITTRFCATWKIPPKKSRLETYEIHKGNENLTDLGDFNINNLLTFFPPNTNALIKNMTISTDWSFLGATLKCNSTSLCNNSPGRFITHPKDNSRGSRPRHSSLSLVFILFIGFQELIVVVSFNFLRLVLEQMDNIVLACQKYRLSHVCIMKDGND